MSRVWIILLVAFCFVCSFSVLNVHSQAQQKENVAYQVSVEKGPGPDGWMPMALAGKTAGDKQHRIEAIKIWLLGFPYASVCYQVSVENGPGTDGWLPMAYEKDLAGTLHENKKVEAIKIWLVNCPGWSVKYQVWMEGEKDWQEEKKDGEMAGALHQSKKLVAIKISLQKIK